MKVIRLKVDADYVTAFDASPISIPAQERFHIHYIGPSSTKWQWRCSQGTEQDVQGILETLAVTEEWRIVVVAEYELPQLQLPPLPV